MKVLLPFSLPFLRLFAKFLVAAVECGHEFVDFFFGGEVRKAYAPGVQSIFAVVFNYLSMFDNLKILLPL